MGDVRWTKEQQDAIETHGCNLLVAAAAGSGKTAVLVERIIKMITDIKNPLDIDRLLVVTFTNAAASEMKERIAKALSDELTKHPRSKQLQRQLTLLNRASITTMHSFCLDVIRNNFHYIDLDPNFRIGDQTETVLLKGEIIEDLFEDLYEPERCTKEFLNLVEYYSSNRDDSAFQNIILSLYDFVMSTPDPKATLYNMAEDFNVTKDYDFGASKWAKVIMEDIKIEVIGLKDMMERAIDIINKTEGLDPYLKNFQDELNMIKEIIVSSDISWNSLYDSIENIKFNKLKPCKNCQDKDAQEEVKNIRNKVKKQMESIKNRIAAYSSSETAENLRNLYPMMKELTEIVLEFMDRYSKAKRERGIIDFDDFEHFCLEILKHSEVSHKLREKFVEILVDEYQDSNEVQESIINSIARKDEATGKNINVFMVGDVKQSIYRFRQAKPELFLQKYSTYPLEEGSNERKITLFKNFRSRKEIIDGTNFIFKQIMSKNIGELEYDDNEALNLGAEYEEFNGDKSLFAGPIEINLIEKNKADSDNSGDDNIDEEEILSDVQIEARLVAEKINELVNPRHGEAFKVYDKDIKGYRNVEYRDIVILLRSTLNLAPIFMDELKENLVPAYADIGSGYFESLEIKTMMSLLQIIDNPRQDIPLIAILRSPIASFTPEELIDIRMEEKNGDFYDGLLKVANSEDRDDNWNELKRKCSSFLGRLNLWREKSIHMPIDEFIWYLYTDTGYYGYVGALSGGVQRQANLKILFQRARQYEKTSYKGLFNFVNFINRLKVSTGDMGSAKILGENDNVVRIMSIHKSKGLEFPVVILSALGKNFNMQDLNKRILFHSQLGFGPDYIDLEKRVSYSTVVKEAIKNKIKIETLSEEMRILYVALTRAKEKLIITGSVSDLEKSCKKWSYGVFENDEKLSEYEILNAKNYLDWICPVVMRHKDGEALRLKAGIEGSKGAILIEDGSKWKIEFYNKNNITGDTSEDTKDIVLDGIENIEDIKLNSIYYDEINKRLNWKYPYIESTKLPTLITVTELKRLQNRDMYDDYSNNLYTPSLVKRPTFMEKSKKLTGAEKGTAIHAVMQKIDFTRVLDEDEIKRQMKVMVLKELITSEQEASVDPKKILNFFNSSIGRRMINAKEVHREVPFHMQVKSIDIDSNLPKDKYEDEYIILQGIIDCYFEEDSGIVLLDYKSDYFKKGEEKSIIDKYKIQVDLYSKAIEYITNRKVKEKYIYLFNNDEEIEVG